MKVNLLGGKIHTAFLTLFASALGSTIISTIYSTVDMMCVGQHSGPTAAAALACVNPLWALMMAPGVLAGVGGSVMMSNRKAGGNLDEARGFYTLSVIIAAIMSALVCAILLIFPRELLTFFGGEGQRLDYAVTYMLPIAIISPTFTMSATLSAFMRNDGEAFTPTFATAIGGGLNIFLDVFLVFGCNLGVLGAGLATAIGQTVAFLIMAAYFFRKKCTLKFTKIKHLGNKLTKIFTLGASAFILELAFAITATAYNKMILNLFTEEHLAVFGTASTVAVMFYCLYNAVGTALQPLVSANYGAGAHERVNKTLKISLAASVALGVAFTLLTQLLPDVILKIYMDVTDGVMKIGPPIVRIYNMAIGFTGISIVLTFYFQSVLRRGASVCISLCRGVIFPLLFVFAFPAIFGADALFYSMPIAELMTFIIALLLLFFAKKRKPLTNNSYGD
ncbi:MAG: hypothetical protein IJW48_00070 [Clostridia bacterium]|nr:hypothetical protein [Clostridia bacterium]